MDAAQHTDSDVEIFLLERYGPALVNLLPTAMARRTAWQIHQRIADYGGDSLARCWMIGMNPALGDRPPILAIGGGHAAEVEAAVITFEDDLGLQESAVDAINQALAALFLRLGPPPQHEPLDVEAGLAKIIKPKEGDHNGT